MTTEVTQAPDTAQIIETLGNTANQWDQVSSLALEIDALETLSYVEITVPTQPDVLEVLVPGPPGPGGTGGGTPAVLDVRADIIAPEDVIKGEAVPGSLETDAVWRIRRIAIDYTSPLSTDTTFAGGSQAFDKRWDQRLVYTYS